MLIPYGGLYTYGDRTTGSGGGDGGAKSRASVALAGQVIAAGSPGDTILFASAPKYDTKNEIDTVQHRFAPRSAGYYSVYISVSLYTVDVAPNINWRVFCYKPLSEIVFLKNGFQQIGSQDIIIYGSVVDYLEIGEYLFFYIEYFNGISSSIIANPQQSYVDIYQL